MNNTFIFLCLLFVSNLSAQSYTVVGENLRLPNGLDIDEQGRIWVTESGYGFDDGAVSILQPNGTLISVVTGLPAFFDTVSMENVGPWHSMILPDNQLGVVSPIDGGILIFDLSGFVPGVSQPFQPADATKTILISDFVYQNQTPGMEDSNPYTATLDGNGNWYVVDAGFNGIIKVDPAGQRSVFCTFDPMLNPTPVGPPYIDFVPTRILAKPGGGFYVCNLTGFPFLDSLASIVSVDQNGVVSPHASGFTMLTDLVLHPGSGDLYALQVGAFDLSIFNFAPASAKVTRLKQNGTREVVAEGFDLSPGLALDASGNIYTSELGLGRILRFDASSSASSEVETILLNDQVSPNPVSDYLQVFFSLSHASEVALRLLDAQGRQIYTENMGYLPVGSHQKSLHRHNWPAGIYWLDLQAGKTLKTHKLLMK